MARLRVLKDRSKVIFFGEEKGVVLGFYNNGGIQVCFFRPFSKNLIRGFTPSEVRAGKIHQCAGTKRKGNKVISFINLSVENAQALKSLLNSTSL